jgi:hypothetical protein
MLLQKLVEVFPFPRISELGMASSAELLRLVRIGRSLEAACSA